MKTVTFEQLSSNQRRIMEEAWDASTHKLGDIMPIGAHMHHPMDSDYEKLTDMKLLHRVLVMAGWRHNEYGYVITPAGIDMMQDTKYVTRRTHRTALIERFVAGEITEAQLLDELENGQP